MTTNQAFLSLLGGLIAMSVVSVASARGGDAELRATLEILASRSIFFGHQSVGWNILEGISDLAAAEGVNLRIVELKDAGGVPQGALVHAAIGQNGDPASKVRAFGEALQRAPGGDPEIALMKLCYVDIGGGTDVSALFSSYQASIKELRSRHPRTTFVHVTAPLVAADGLFKGLAKRLLGRESAAGANSRRERFNALLRQAYRGREPLFDLALLESTGPDGAAVMASFAGGAVPMLAGAYTDDGGHLNQAGRRRVARELVVFLAALPISATSTSGAR